MAKRRFEFAIVRIHDLGRDIGWTYDVESRHESLANAVRAFDRRYPGHTTAEIQCRFMGLDRFSKPDGNGFMTPADARRCVGP